MASTTIVQKKPSEKIASISGSTVGLRGSEVS